jgi:hypothetical protein
MRASRAIPCATAGRGYLRCMVDLHVRDGALDLELRGLHKLWALKNRLRVPVAAIKAARRAQPTTLRNPWKGWRAPGTHVPGVFVAGTYYKSGERHFWDVRRGDRAIEIDLEGADYHRIVVEVDDPDAALRTIERARTVDLLS